METLVSDLCPEKGIAIILFFRLIGPHNELALCRSYRVGAALELRFGIDGETAFMSEEVGSHSQAMTLAGEWRSMLTQNGFVEP
jgi:hypothetical protein